GDRVGGFMPNMPQTVIAMLATTSLGAVWSSCPPDFGVRGVLDRFARLQPKVLFTADASHYSGRRFNCLEKIAGILAALHRAPRIVVVPHIAPRPALSGLAGAVTWDEFCSSAPPANLEFQQLPADHPVYIMFSSGTTGLPKCIVQPAGGILVNQLKE